MDLLTSAGMSAFIVEKFNPYAGAYGVREDFMGFIDIIAMTPELGIVGVQACGTDWGSHITKLTTERRGAMNLWTSCGGKTWLIGWRKLLQRNKDGKVGKRAQWVPRVAVWDGETLAELKPEPLFSCLACATRLGAVELGGSGRFRPGRCGKCGLPSYVAPVDNWKWLE